MLALFCGLLLVPVYGRTLGQLLTTPRGWALIVTELVVGGHSAAFAMAIGLFFIPILLERALMC